MAKNDDIKNRIKTLLSLSEAPGLMPVKTPIESSLAALVVIDGQMALLLAELIDEISATRKDLDEMNQTVKRIERH